LTVFVSPGEVMVVGIVFGTTSLTILSLARMRMRAREQREPIADPGLDDRLYRIEQAVDAIAVEVERISESQRFTSRLIAERLPSPAAVPGLGAERGSPS
jgi:hypothetical protein